MSRLPREENTPRPQRPACSRRGERDLGADLAHLADVLARLLAAAWRARQAAGRNGGGGPVSPPEPERLRRAEMARRAHFARLALKSARARSNKKTARVDETRAAERRAAS